MSKWGKKHRDKLRKRENDSRGKTRIQYQLYLASTLQEFHFDLLFMAIFVPSHTVCSEGQKENTLQKFLKTERCAGIVKIELGTV